MLIIEKVVMFYKVAAKTNLVNTGNVHIKWLITLYRSVNDGKGIRSIDLGITDKFGILQINNEDQVYSF